ncbi:U3 small nucleolar RNA-associated protein 6 homolog [Galleria mellonella]|uniref:U3 small nucleolar RNA-associated protein 6 homolog n=1 Tax=Galleria mellonella TaxID=7137 RepID=A0A6J1WZV5_GALME|nr:U3 small nucleolar RNA-associated protein 6 homolog [Galleria mellonella]
MAEQVNQRIEDMINELEQMRRTNLFDDEEIREISRKRKEFEYRIQRRVKSKEDFINYIAYELLLLENISLRRKQNKMNEKKNDIEYAIARRMNKVFKQFIYRFQNDIEIYFEYMKFCRSVGFDHAISGIIGQMLQIHGDKPKMWLLASKWERLEQNNLKAAKQFLLKGIHRHPESQVLYLELFEIELTLLYQAETDEDKEKQIKIADVVWRNGIKNINNVTFLFDLCNLCLKCETDKFLTDNIKKEIWSRLDQKEVWSYIASKELEGCHWEECEEFLNSEHDYSQEINIFMGLYEEALQRFPDEKLCTKYIHELLGVQERICSDYQKIRAVKQAWLFAHDNGLLTNDLYAFGISMLKLENEISNSDLMEILNNAAKKNPQARCIWEEKLLLNNSDEKKMLSIAQEASKVLKSDDALYIWNLLLDNVKSNDMLKNLHKRFQNCENIVILTIKPKLLQKMYDYIGLKAARDLYEEFIKTPPLQVEVHKVMIDIEKTQDKPNSKNIRKCYEMLIQLHGTDNFDLWMEYMKFETDSGNVQAVPNIYRRAIGSLKKELADEFIKAQTLAKLN